MFYKVIPHLMGFVLICITIGGHEHEFSQFFPKFGIALKYIFRHILLIIPTCDLELFRKLPILIGNIMWKLEDHSYSSKRAILLQSWHIDIRKNSILCIKRRLVSRYIAHSVCCDVILVAIQVLGWQIPLEQWSKVIHQIWEVKGHWTLVNNVVLGHLLSYECRIVLKLDRKDLNSEAKHICCKW